MLVFLGDLTHIFKNKIIPLLQEYFYDDWEKIRLVLNDGFIEKVEQKPNKIFEGIDDDYIDEEKFFYNVRAEFSKNSYIKIYDKLMTIEEEA